MKMSLAGSRDGTGYGSLGNHHCQNQKKPLRQLSAFSIISETSKFCECSPQIRSSSPHNKHSAWDVSARLLGGRPQKHGPDFGMSAAAKHNEVKASLFGEVNDGARRMACSYLTFEFYPGLEGAQVGDGEGFLIKVIGKLLLFFHLTNGGSVMR